MDLSTAFILLVLFQVKHLFADFFLQTAMMLANRSQYLHAGRAMHCVVHAVGSLLVMLLVGVPLGLLLLILVLEWVVHYHIDYFKGAWSDRTGHSPADAGYWRAFGTDQFFHQLTYVGMVWLLI